MSDTATHRYSFDLLRGPENYATWKVQISDVITDYGLDDHLEESADAKNVGASADPNGAGWKKDDRKALSTIRLRVTPAIVTYIASATTAREAWTTLSSMYESKGPLGIILARRKFYGTRVDPGASIEEHVRTMRGYADELRTLTYPISAADFSITLLTSLPDTWDGFIAAAIDEDALKDQHKVVAKVLMEQRRLQERNGTAESSDSTKSTALAARSGPYPHKSQNAQQNGQPTWHRNIRCNTCGGTGHIARVCPTNSTQADDHAHVAVSAEDNSFSDFEF